MLRRGVVFGFLSFTCVPAFAAKNVCALRLGNLVNRPQILMESSAFLSLGEMAAYRLSAQIPGSAVEYFDDAGRRLYTVHKSGAFSAWKRWAHRPHEEILARVLIWHSRIRFNEFSERQMNALFEKASEFVKSLDAAELKKLLKFIRHETGSDMRELSVRWKEFLIADHAALLSPDTNSFLMTMPQASLLSSQMIRDFLEYFRVPPTDETIRDFQKFQFRELVSLPEALATVQVYRPYAAAYKKLRLLGSGEALRTRLFRRFHGG